MLKIGGYQYPLGGKDRVLKPNERFQSPVGKICTPGDELSEHEHHENRPDRDLHPEIARRNRQMTKCTATLAPQPSNDWSVVNKSQSIRAEGALRTTEHNSFSDWPTSCHDIEKATDAGSQVKEPKGC